MQKNIHTDMQIDAHTYTHAHTRDTYRQNASARSHTQLQTQHMDIQRCSHAEKQTRMHEHKHGLLVRDTKANPLDSSIKSVKPGNGGSLSDSILGS